MTVSSPEQAGLAEYRVGSVSALERGEAVLTPVGGTEVALFLCRGKVVATQGRCPHAQGPLHEGEVEGTTLTCPWHGWSFDLTTGECAEDESMHLKRYPVRIDGDDVYVSV
jgi:nitrite reductase (NADH) small subunit